MVQKEKYIIKTCIKNICKPSSKMKSKPEEESMTETECLYGEEVKVQNIIGKWAKCTTLFDNYEGWIQINDVFKLENSTHRIISPRSFIFKEPNIKSYILSYLPMGSKIKVKSYCEKWASIQFFNNKYKMGFLLKKHIVPKDNINKDWVELAEQLIGTPYKWGGRDTIGIDCSALVQLSLETIGVKFPRNSEDQEKLNIGVPYNRDILSRGSLVYWNGHVGIMRNKNDLLHANAYHMMVTSEDLFIAMKRINVEYGPIKKIVNNYIGLIN